MSDMIKLIFSLTLSGSIIAVLIFAIKPLVKHKMSKSIQYYLWLVVLLRLIIPFSFEGSFMNYLFYNDTPSSEISAKVSGQPTDTAGVNTSVSSDLTALQVPESGTALKGSIDYIGYLKDFFIKYEIYIWLLGVIIALSINLAGYLRFTRYIKSTNKATSDEEKGILNALIKGRHKVGLVRNPFVSTPMLIGLFRPCIVVPDTVYDEVKFRNILIHELTHMKRFDIAIKWLTMIAASIHWFNPLMYFIKKEINRACELACDEAVIKNLSDEEKQAYGDTLISVVAKQNYPVGVLQATLCEEKKSLKERLLAIMKHTKRSRFIIIISVLLMASAVAGAIALGASIGIGAAGSEPPPIYINTEGEKTKTAITGSYTWHYGNKVGHADTIHPLDFDYTIENTLNLSARAQMIIGTQKIKPDKKYGFTLEGVTVFKDGKETELKAPEPSFMNGNLYLQAPAESGEYVYVVNLNFRERGNVSYGFLVRVGMMTYDLAEISKHRTPYIGNNSKVMALVGHLPVPYSYFRQRYISLITDKEPYKLNVYYEAIENETYGDEWPVKNPDSPIYSNMQKNALVLFCMIDNLGSVTFNFRNSPSKGDLDTSEYRNSFTFSRASIQDQFGDPSALGKDLNLLQQELEGRGKKEEAIEDGKIAAEFSDEEVFEAEKVVREYFRAVAAKDDKAILKTLTPGHDAPNVILYGKETRTLMTVDYNPDDPMRESYLLYGRGKVNKLKKENVIVFKVRYNVKYPKGATGPFNEGDYTNWSMILIRENRNSPWLIDDQGY